MISDGSPITNDQLLHRVRSASRHLRDLGIRHDDVVTVALRDRLEFVVLMFAAWRLGAAVMPIDWPLDEEEVDRLLIWSGADSW